MHLRKFATKDRPASPAADSTCAAPKAGRRKLRERGASPRGSESEVAVQQALQVALAGRTSLVIAHRLSTIRRADVILVVDGGRVVETGNHDSLLAAGGLYADLYRTQFQPQDDGGSDSV